MKGRKYYGRTAKNNNEKKGAPNLENNIIPFK